MADNYTAYLNLYHYMNSVWNQIQTVSRSGTQTYGRGAVGNQSFYNTFQNTVKNISAPESMDSIFEEAAQLYNVPLALLKAVGKAESGFNADAVSAAGAQGVMQLMPATAKALGVEDPFDARSNIMGGAKYIAEKLNQYNGDIELALAAYNAGSGNVSKYGGVPPFAETQNYIRRIKEYMGMDLTTGQTVQGQTAVSMSDGSGLGISDTRGITDLTAQYLMAKMQLKMQDEMNSLALSVSEEKENNDRIL